jgi:anaerobic selenocysteine-containing dehydrogenase
LHDWEIFTELGNRVAALMGKEPSPVIPPDQIMDMGLQAGPYSESRGSAHKLTMAKLREHPSGIDLGELQSQLPERLRSKNKLIHCNTPEPLADLARVRAAFANQGAPDALQLIGRRNVRSNNSWMHNFHHLVKGKERCTLMMHPDDMQQRDLTDGAVVTVTSRTGNLQVAAQASEDMMPGVVSLPHGYGHNRDGIRMSIASTHAGVSCNDITDELALDALSGNAAVNGVPVTVSLPA